MNLRFRFLAGVHFLFGLAVACRAVAVVPAYTPQIFYADNDLSIISRLNIGDGSDPEHLLQTRRGLVGLTVDRSAGQIYWADNGDATATSRSMIHRANLDGSDQVTLYTAALNPLEESAGQLQLDLAAQHIYWVDRDRVRRMNLDGSNVVTVSTVPFLGGAIELDRVNNHLYFTTGFADNAKIERMDLDGSNRVAIANVYGYSIALDIANQNIYAADWFNHRLMRVGFDGSGLTQLAMTPAIRDVQVVNGRLYYPNVRSVAPDNTGPYFFQWITSDLDGSNPIVLYEVPRAQGPRDMIQFEIVPEPSTIMLGLALAFTGRVPRRTSE